MRDSDDGIDLARDPRWPTPGGGVHTVAVERYTLEDFITDDPEMRACLELARVAARTELPILILGESGTGKTLLARAIHNSSPRASAPFIAFNAAALSETLVDSQLFGHERGAFTGATRRVKGKFELAHGGTLFIDEIADMATSAQAKILRAVEHGEFERLGSETLQNAVVRLISATHLPIHRFIGSDHFRRDLFYRISGITIHLPPLRERPGDLRALIAAEIANASRHQQREITALSKVAAARLFAHRWPGNLRELRQVLHTAVALTEGDTIQSESILLGDLDEPSHHDGAVREGELEVTRPTIGEFAPHRHDDVAPHAGEGDLRLRTIELRHIHLVLDITGGNKRRAARLLGLSRSTLDRKLSGADGAAASDRVSRTKDVTAGDRSPSIGHRASHQSH
ncbi:MAG TPA: sigma 54-interacting transcriptional regulator [Gemmatimonadaceae bacterium]|nr:sigma 54-interacting transcriptional regulator [Gemmatimonadaceae bacterium]